MVAVPSTCIDTTGLACTLTTNLDHGQYYWRVNINGVTSSLYRRLIVSPALPVAPALVAPLANRAINDNTPTIVWQGTTSTEGGPFKYDVQIDNNANFSSVTFAVNDVNGTSLVVSPALPDGVYNLRIRTVNTHGGRGTWSAARVFTVDTTAPPTPTMIAPVNNAVLADNTPTFTWGSIRGVTRYRVEISTSPTFNTFTLVGIGTLNTYTVPNANGLPDGTYYARVRSMDSAGNVSAPSATRRFVIDAP
jgi:predicted phage tail protein